MFKKFVKYLSLLKNSLTFKKILLGFFIVVLLLFVFLFLFLKSNFSYTFIENYFNKMTGLKIEFINPSTTFNLKADLNFKIDEINIYNEDKSVKFANINNTDLLIKPFGFIFKKANIKKLSTDNININLYKDNKGKIELYDILKNKDFTFLKKNKITLTRLILDIKDIEINYVNDYKIQSSIKFKFKQTNADISKKKKNFTFVQKGYIETTINSNKQICNIDTKINSKYPFNTLKPEDLNIDIKLSEFNLYTLNDLAKKYISKDIDVFSGNLDLNIQTKENSQELISKVKNLKLELNDKKIIIPYKENIVLTLLFNIEKNNFKIDKLKLYSNDLNIESYGKISKIFSKKPDVDLNINIIKTQLNNFTYLLCDNLIYYNLKGIPTLKKSNFFAVLDGKMNLKLFPLDITGNLKASNVYIPNYPKAYRQNDVNAYFMKNKMRIYTRVYTPQNEYVTVDGVSNLDNSLYGKYSVTSTQNIDLAFAKLYLVPLQQILGFNIGPVPIMDIKGVGNIDIKTQGTVFDAQIFGTFKAQNASAQIEGLDAKLTNGNCELVFNNRELIFKKIQGKIDKADFLLTGTGNTKGEVDLNSQIKNISASNALKIFKNSIISKRYVSLFKNIAALSGLMDVKINLKGTIKDYEDKNFFNDLALSGNLNLKNNKIILNNKIKVNSIKGEVQFGDIQKANLDFNINNSRFNTILIAKQNLEKISEGNLFDIDSSIVSSKISSKDIIDEITAANLLDKKYISALKIIRNIGFYSKLNLHLNGKISLNNFDLSNIKTKGTLLCLNDSLNEKIKFNNGMIKFENNSIFFNNFLADLMGGNIKINGNIDKFLSRKQNYNLEVALDNILLDEFNNIIPNIKLNNSIIKNGKILLKQNNLKLSNININYDSMPVFLNANIKDIFNTKTINADFSTILNETTTDNIINPFLIYPVKIKGEVPIRGQFKGKADNYSIDFLSKIPKDSDISFTGANIGDTNYNREISGKIDVNNSLATISNLKLIKYIANQNNKINPLVVLKVNGQIKQENENFLYKNFKVSTMSPMNVRVLNMVFKKSLLKQGNFECAVNLEGNTKTPKVTGNIKLYDLDIPLYDTKINNIDVDINNNYINAIALAKNKQSDLNLSLKAKNRLNPPYIVEKLNIESNKLIVQDVLNSMEPQNKKTDITLKEDLLIKPNDVIIKQGTFSAADVNYNKINAKNLKGVFDFSNNIFNLKNLNLDIAKGNIEAKGKYNLDTTLLNVDAKMNDCDSNILTKEFLNLSDQIFGKINGSITLSAKGLNTPDNIKNVKSSVDFVIYEGKMPKLGSLEYLLRAGNIVKNGLLGLSLNNLIQILTPYKTGEFEKISGSLILGNGEVQNLEILSKGKNLSLYLEGNYDILKNFADIKIYGKLSQKISNVLGAAGNASIKQFLEIITPVNTKNTKDEELTSKLEKIPSVENEQSNPKYFRAKVLGDINKENYIKSFNWL